MSKTFVEVGQSIQPDQLLIITKGVTEDIYKRFSMLSQQEIEMAFYRGVRGEFGEYFGINIVTFNRWLQGFMDSGAHYKFIMDTTKGQKQLSEKTEPTDQEKKDILKAGVKRCYLHWKNNKGEIIDYGNPVYDFLVEIGKINLTQNQKENYLLKATITITGELKEKSISIDRIERQNAKRILQGLEENNEIESLSKNYALSDYFKKISR